MPRGVTLEDAGFFTLAAADAGVNHPPGYPLHALLGHLFTLLPFAEIAARVALLSALCAAASCAVLWLLARDLGLSPLAAALASTSYGVSGVLWSQAIIPEVYTLNAFLCFALLACCQRAALRESGAAQAAAALCAGLGLANHWPLALLCWPGAALLLWPARGALLRRAPQLALLFLLPPLALYAFMVWSSQREGAITFVGPLLDARAALDYVLRRIYSETHPYRPDAAQVFALARFYAIDGALQLTLPGSALACIGFACCWRRWPLRIAVAFGWVCLGALAVLVTTQDFRDDMLGRSVVRVYPIVPWGVLALWLAQGFEEAARLARRSIAWRPLAPLAAAALVAWIALAQAGPNDRRRDDWAERYARAVLEALPENAVLFTSDDLDTAPIGYAHALQGMRPDVALYNDMGLLFPNRILDGRTSAAERERRLASFVLTSERPVFAIANWKLPGVPLHPYGFFFELAPPRAVRTRVTQRAEAALEALVLAEPGAHPWNRFHRDRLVASFAHWIATRLEGERRPAERARLLALRERLERHFMGRLASLAAEQPRTPADELWPALEELGARLPHEPDLTAADVAALFYLRGVVRRRQGLEAEAGREFLRAVEALPRPHLNQFAFVELARHYALTGQTERLAELLRRSGGDPALAAAARAPELEARRPE